MERLTGYEILDDKKDKLAYYIKNGYKYFYIHVQTAIDKLAAYEDTGLEPNEIATVKAENEELKEQLRVEYALNENNIAIANHEIDTRDKRIGEEKRRAEILERGMLNMALDILAGTTALKTKYSKDFEELANLYKNEAAAELEKEGE